MTEQLPGDPSLEPLSRTQILVAIGVTALILLVVAKLWQALGPVTLLPIEWEGTAFASGVVLGIGITAASTLVYWLWPTYRQCANTYLALVLSPLLWPDLLWLGLLPGLSEELLFRGVMLSALGLTPLGLLISSLCFGVLHLGGLQSWPYAVWATVVGLLLGLSTLATGNLLVPVVAHIVTNLTSSCFWKLAQHHA